MLITHSKLLIIGLKHNNRDKSPIAGGSVTNSTDPDQKVPSREMTILNLHYLPKWYKYVLTMLRFQSSHDLGLRIVGEFTFQHMDGGILLHLQESFCQRNDCVPNFSTP